MIGSGQDQVILVAFAAPAVLRTTTGTAAGAQLHRRMKQRAIVR
jgi:hypothetical protein